MPPRLRLAIALLHANCVLAGAGAQQQIVPPPLQLSPQAAYDQAIHPVDVVHKSMANWSDSELSAIAVAIKNASAACAAREPEQFNGDDLIAYDRLCSFGQDWSRVGVAAQRYIDSRPDPRPQLALAYGFKLESDLHKQDLPVIMKTAKALLDSVPYDAVADLAINEALEYLQLAYTTNALEIAGRRQTLLLAALKSAKPILPPHILYADGLAAAALYQYIGLTTVATATVATLDAALPQNLQPDETIPIADARRRYDLLGNPLPTILYTLALFDLKGTPHINPDMGNATALFLFPDWCAQCVRMGTDDLPKALPRLAEHDVRLYILLAEAAPNKDSLIAKSRPPVLSKKAALQAPDPAPPTPTELLLHTPTLVVPTETLTTFAASDFPFVIVLDHAGIVRFAAPAPESALLPGGFLDRLWQHVEEAWPRPEPTAPMIK